MLLNVVQYHTLFSRDVRRDIVGAAEECEGVLRYPMIVKPASQGSSIGIAAAHDREELTAALAAASEFDRKIIVEEKLENFREVNCAAYSDGESIVVSETETPISAGELLTFEDKYLGGGKAGEGRVTPADVGEELNALIKSLTERIYRAFFGGYGEGEGVCQRGEHRAGFAGVLSFRAPRHNIPRNAHRRNRGRSRGRAGESCETRIPFPRAGILRQRRRQDREVTPFLAPYFPTNLTIGDGANLLSNFTKKNRP